MSSARQQLSQREIDEVLRHYRVGAVRDIRELPEGSFYSPKVVLDTERGTMLLKRRARGLDMPALVAFGHEVLLGCQQHGLCVPPLIGTVGENNSFVQHADHVYELFVFIEGNRFDAVNPKHAFGMGSLLHETHRVMDMVRPSFAPASEPGTIDLSRLAMLKPIDELLPPGLSADFERIASYAHELSQANARPTALVHGDWHPGNMIYRADTLVAVCDFDNTRVGSRDRELAQALMHASMIAPSPGQGGAMVPPEPDPLRLDAFWQGYTRAGGKANARTIAGLMPGVMIDEALASLGPSPSEQHGAMLIAIWRKAKWLDEHQHALIEQFAG